MRTLPLAPSVEPPVGPRPREGCAELARGRHANPATGTFGGTPVGHRSSRGVRRTRPKPPCEPCRRRL
eukprot:4344883-Pyramimonas_sp.AAC.1